MHDLTLVLSTLILAGTGQWLYQTWITWCNSFSGWVAGLPINQWGLMWLAHFAITRLHHRNFVEYREFEGRIFASLKLEAWRAKS